MLTINAPGSAVVVGGASVSKRASGRSLAGGLLVVAAFTAGLLGAALTLLS